jgi:hypothetical protein
MSRYSIVILLYLLHYYFCILQIKKIIFLGILSLQLFYIFKNALSIYVLLI